MYECIIAFICVLEVCYTATEQQECVDISLTMIHIRTGCLWCLHVQGASDCSSSRIRLATIGVLKQITPINIDDTCDTMPAIQAD